MSHDRVLSDRLAPAAQPPGRDGSALDRLIASGRVSRPVRRDLPPPLVTGGDPHALTRALDATRGES